MYSLSGHKIHAPKGIGALYVASGASVKPLLFGGGQELGFRSGTENTPMIAAFAAAAEESEEKFEENYSKKRGLIEHAFRGVRGEVLAHELEKDGILVGIGSACSSHRESRFKKLLGLPREFADGIVRFSVSEFNTDEEMVFAAKKAAEAAKKLSAVAPR